MAKETPGHAHDIDFLNVVFALSSIGLLLATIWLVWADYSREWKVWQRKFRELERQTTQNQLQAARQAIDQAELQALQRQIGEADQAMAAQQAAIAGAENKRQELANQRTLSDIRFRELKSVYDSRKYYFEEELHKHPQRADGNREDFEELEREFLEAQTAFTRLDFEFTQADRELKSMRARRSEIEARQKSLNERIDLLQRKLASIAPSFPNFFRNLPVVDFIDPSIKIRQVLVQHVTEDLNFTQVPRIDRCMTCHLGIDNPDYQEAPQPFRTHPKLDLFVKRESPHPIDNFGCTSCHYGRGRGTTFFRVVHTPRNDAQRAEWEENYGWEPDHYWDQPMFPAQFSESGCLKCHADVVHVPEADAFNRGRDLYEKAGCWGCHNTKGFENRRKVGPNLAHIVSKTTPEWAARWVKNPKSFKPSTRMPRFWDLDNNLDSELGSRNSAEVASIVAYIFKKAEPLNYRPAPRGDAAAGKLLVESVGCFGCHITDEEEVARASAFRRHGPSLAGAGSKLNREFLFNWLKDPKHYWPDTFMPNLRLTDKEAADIASYILSLRHSAFEALPVPQADRAALDEIALEFLRTGLPDRLAKEKLGPLSEEEKKLYAGEKLILRYGCFGCHDISGFEKAQKIGVDLSDWGSKIITRLDFGYVDIEHSRQAWLEQKLRAPRSFDRGKIKTPAEKLRMPYFALTDQEIEDVVRNVLGQVRDEVPLEAVKKLDAGEELAEQGRLLVHQFNCQGCHLIEGKGGGIYEKIEDPGFHPPNLNTQGAKVQADWLFNFLKQPTTIRPWLTARMPTFQFSDDQANTLVRYFMALEGSHPFETRDRPPDRDKLVVGETLLNRLRCLQCHVLEAAGTLSAAQLAPNFQLARDRLREEWIVRWLIDPQRIMPGTQMPQFWPQDDSGKPMTPLPDILGGDALRQMEAVSAYIMEIGREGRAAGGAGR